RDILNETVDGDAVCPGVIRCQVSASYLWCHPLWMPHGQPNRQTGKSVEPAQHELPDHGAASKFENCGHCRLVEGRCVEDDKSRRHLRVACGATHADRAAPVVEHKRDGVEVQVGHECLEVPDVLFEGIGVVLRFVRQ